MLSPNLKKLDLRGMMRQLEKRRRCEGSCSCRTVQQSRPIRVAFCLSAAESCPSCGDGLYARLDIQILRTLHSPIPRSQCVPNTSTKNVNWLKVFKQRVKGSATCSLAINTPSAYCPFGPIVTVALSPPKPPSAFNATLPLVRLATSATRCDNGGLPGLVARSAVK